MPSCKSAPPSSVIAGWTSSPAETSSAWSSLAPTLRLVPRITFAADFVLGKTVRWLRFLSESQRNNPSPPRDCKAEAAHIPATRPGVALEDVECACKATRQGLHLKRFAGHCGKTLVVATR